MKRIFQVIILTLIISCGNKYSFTSEKLSKLIADQIDLQDAMITSTQLEELGEIQYIDIRSARDFGISHPQGAVNIQIPDLLDPKHSELLGNPNTNLLIYGKDPGEINKAWIILGSIGIENVRMFTTLDGPDVAKYDYAKLWSDLVENTELDAPSIELPPPPKVIPVTRKPKPVKEKKEEGC